MMGEFRFIQRRLESMGMTAISRSPWTVSSGWKWDFRHPKWGSLWFFAYDLRQAAAAIDHLEDPAFEPIGRQLDLSPLHQALRGEG